VVFYLKTVLITRKRHFFQVHQKNVFVKKEEKWAKITSGPLKYISLVQKEPFIDIFI